ncbi:proton-conducting transporter membrane subunit [Thioalkalivibrio sp. XN8]|uniref:complex I subunit 5 family protein n=1 Tax=Thioalkalivibrio sp. XN8 TaxID=2712863 RepID=UPI0013E9AB05|nr:proton-conducting transporter membrane subunit [Thioalkalivibrio sp. XN8]NGP52694.1 oxidoreductase [Thioalkalivibrio sp. XN8]
MSTWLAALPWMVLAIAIPLLGALAAFVQPRRAQVIGLSFSFLTAGAAVGVVLDFITLGPQQHAVGGWGAPLGIDLVADGLSILMLGMSAVVGVAVSIYARAYFVPYPDKAPRFWPLWLFLWAALNALFQSADVFNLYVTLELMGLSAVALVALTGSGPALWGAMRYLLVSLLGSLAYLVGVALLYHAYGTVDLTLLAERADGGLQLAVPLGAMIAGLLLKTGLFPFHVWLPPAHGSARAPVSALLSGLVVKASFYLVLRLWFTFVPEGEGLPLLLGCLGAAAIFWGSIQALRQKRLKLLVAYSTVAQLGYLFIAFPLAGLEPQMAWSGSIYLALSHAFAKGAMFLAAGAIMTQGGHDEIDELDLVVDRMPLTLAAFALAGISLAGLPPSGGFVGKWLLLESAMAQGKGIWAAIIIVGGLLTATYVFRVLGFAFTRSEHHHERHEVPAAMEWTALLLALGAVLLGFVAPWALPLLDGVLP